MTSIYAQKEVGEVLFTPQYAEVWAKTLYSELFAQEGFAESEQGQELIQSIEDLISSNKEIIIQRNATLDEIKALDDVLIQSQLTNFGTNITPEQALNLLNEGRIEDNKLTPLSG